MRDTFPVLVGTVVSQTFINLLALVLLGVIIVSTTDLFHSGSETIFAFSFVPLVLLLVVLISPIVMRKSTRGDGRIARLARRLAAALSNVRLGLQVFRDPRRGPFAIAAQLLAWAIQLASCWALLYALGLEDKAGIGAAAAVLFAVNVTAVVPATPSNIGIFQLAVISVLTTGFDVGKADALAYGVILQAVEIATAVILGVPHDGGTTYQPGARFAPFHVRRTSGLVQNYHTGHRGAGFSRISAVDGGNIVFPPFDRAAMRESVFAMIHDLASKHAVPFVVGGDHSITTPILRAIGPTRARSRAGAPAGDSA